MGIFWTPRRLRVYCSASHIPVKSKHNQSPRSPRTSFFNWRTLVLAACLAPALLVCVSVYWPGGAPADTAAAPGAVDTTHAPDGGERGAPGHAHPMARGASTPAVPDTVEERIRKRLSRSHEGLEIIRHPDGHRILDIKGGFGHMSAATVNADGTLSIQCFSDADGLLTAITTEGAPAHPARKRLVYR